jgi:peptidoglycan-N-acetylglucosamine deacetylase
VLRLGRAGGGHAAGVISVWAGWERLMLKRYRLQAARPGSVFLFRLERHRGADRRLADGTLVRHGDPLLELHFDNRRMLAMRSEPHYSTWRIIHTLRGDLVALGARLAAGELGPVVALHGVSLAGGAGSLAGFETAEVPHTWKTRFERYFLAGLDAIYHPAGLERLKGRVKERWPVEVWMSAQKAISLARKGT